jgi:hypothetical protein
VVPASWPRRAPAGLTGEVCATERVYEVVKKGVPFREAYGRACEEQHSALMGAIEWQSFAGGPRRRAALLIHSVPLARHRLLCVAACIHSDRSCARQSIAGLRSPIPEA